MTTTTTTTTQGPRDVYASSRVSNIDVSPKAVGSTIESVSIVDLGEPWLVIVEPD